MVSTFQSYLLIDFLIDTFFQSKIYFKILVLKYEQKRKCLSFNDL